MNKHKKITDNHAFFVDFSLFWVVFGWLALALTLLDFFNFWILIFYILTGGAYFIWTVAKRRRQMKFSKSFIMINIALAVFVIALSFFSTPTVFTGRDQGSISNAAILLSENGKLAFSTPVSDEFFSIYGPGKALNFPGFHYTNQGELTTQFPLGYISWLASFYSIFGINGFILANTTALFIFLLSFYMVGRRLLKKRYALLMTLFAVTSFSFVWFSKYTLSENLTLALLWTMIMSILYLVKTPSKKTLLLFVLSSTLLVFTRVEGYAFFAVAATILLFDKQSREFIKSNRRYIAIAIVIFLSVFALNFQKDLPFFKEVGKATIGSFFEKETDGKIIMRSLLSPGIRISQIYVIYGLAGFFLAGFFGAIIAFRKKTGELLIPLLITAPTFIYLIDSNISSDHPWMLRRFVFAVLPVFIFYSAHLMKHLFEKNPGNSRHPMLLRYLAITISVLLLIINLKSFGRFAFFSENQNLLKQTEALSQKFSDRDLILVDRTSSGDGWSLLSGPMRVIFKKQAAYLFNISDLKKIDLQKFDKIFLIVPKEQISTYASSDIGSRLDVLEKYSLETTRLSEPQEKNLLPLEKFPHKETIVAEGYILEMKK